VQTHLAPDSAIGWRLHWELVFHLGDRLEVVLEGVPLRQLPGRVPRLGVETMLWGGCRQVQWFGRGPGESYADTGEATPFGWYVANLEEMETPYVYPQENGNRSGVRWLAVRDAEGYGILVAGQDLNFSLHPYSAVDLTRARHRHELPRRERNYLTIDFAQNGLGSGSCGPDLVERYRCVPRRFTLRFVVQALLPGEALPRWTGLG